MEGEIPEMPNVVRLEEARRKPPVVPPPPPPPAEEFAPSGGPPEPEPQKPFGTDTWLAEEFVRRHGQELRYCGPWKSWLVYEAGRWVRDESGRAAARMKDTVRALYQDAGKEPDPEQRARLAKFAVKSESAGARNAALGLAAVERAVQVLPEHLDTDPMLLNCTNGTVDLRSGQLRPHQRGDLLTRRARTHYDPEATAPRWGAFLRRIFAEGEEMVAFVQRMAGYTLSADIGEHCMFILHGSTGANGKSTFANTILALLDSYAGAAPEGLLLAKRHQTHPAELVKLFKLRMCVASETKEGARLDESRVKALTGGDPITARGMGENFWDFEPTHKLWLYTNHKPKIRGEDAAIWRRLVLVPFEVQIPEGERDKGFPRWLLANELPGILRWAVEGCLAWQRQGLAPPEKVRAATDAYRAAEDVLGKFLDECCLTGNTVARCSSGDLYERYTRWCSDLGEYALSQRDLGTRLEQRGFEPGRGHGGVRQWLGLGLLTEASGDAGDANSSSPA